MPVHNFSVWRETASDAPVGPLWAKCRCGWSGYGRTYEAITLLCEEHRADAERLEELEREEAEHA